MKNGCTWLALFATSCLVLAGCTRTSTEAPPPEPPEVKVSYPVEREVTDHADYTGRTAAVESVEVRARVWGFLDKVNFKEGMLVKKGAVLYEIDPRPYQTAVAQAEGKLASANAKLKRANADLVRAEQLFRKDAISREDFDKFSGDRGEAAASLDALKAAVDQAKLDLTYTKVIAPVSGRVSRTLLTEGNLISSSATGGTLLTTIVSVDPIYAYFDVDERMVQYVRGLIRAGKAKSARDVKITVKLGLATETGFPHEGTIDFVDNQVNPKTGTLKLRGLFPNPDEVLSPGYFVRVRIPIGFRHPAKLISERALDTDQGQKIVYVVGADNKIGVRPVTVGARHDGLRAIDEGLKGGEQIVVEGLQQVRPGMVVAPKVVVMPESK